MKRMWSKNELKYQIENVKKDINTLVDSAGHDRFIEGDIDLKTITGTEKIYGKWALSGTHLLMVLCISIDNATDISNKNLTSVNLPDWIKEKIIPLGSSVIERGSFLAFGSDNSSQQLVVYLEKDASNNILINTSSFTATADRNVRINFDLLID